MGRLQSGDRCRSPLHHYSDCSTHQHVPCRYADETSRTCSDATRLRPLEIIQFELSEQQPKLGRQQTLIQRAIVVCNEPEEVNVSGSHSELHRLPTQRQWSIILLSTRSAGTAEKRLFKGASGRKWGRNRDGRQR